MNLLLSTAAENMQVDISDLQNIINLSLKMNSLDALHDYDTYSNHSTNCPSNGMDDVLSEVARQIFDEQNQ